MVTKTYLPSNLGDRCDRFDSSDNSDNSDNGNSSDSNESSDSSDFSDSSDSSDKKKFTQKKISLKNVFFLSFFSSFYKKTYFHDKQTKIAKVFLNLNFDETQN